MLAGDELEVDSIEVEEDKRMHRVKVRVVEDALDANNTIASANRADFDREGVTVLNLMSAPGAGKTTLLEKALPGLEGVRPGVLEGDVAGSLDADRLADKHIPVTQLNTDQGFGGECHLDANMVRSALPSLPLADIDLLVIENVGNLVCPAEFRVGEDARVMVSSVTEGEDKPLKYPLMFRACELVIVNKIDLLEHLDFDMEKFDYHLDGVHPGRAADARQRAHGGGDRRGPRLARAARDAGRARRREAGRGDRPHRALLAAHEANRAFFAAEADRIARLCHEMSERFAARRAAARDRRVAGGAVGRAPRRGRVRPPGDRRQARAARGRVRGAPTEVGAAGRGRTTWCSRSTARRRRAASTIAIPTPPSDDPFIRQELTETYYHLLWELVHVFFEHRGRQSAGGGAASFLYPFLDEKATDVEAVIADVAALGGDEGRRDRRAARADADRGRARRCTRRRSELRARLDAGGTLLALGNGGSATDAMDVVADFRAARRGARSTSPRTRRSSPRSPTTSAPTRSSRAR